MERKEKLYLGEADFPWKEQQEGEGDGYSAYEADLAEQYFRDIEEEKLLYGEETYRMIDNFRDLAMRLREKGLSYRQLKEFIDYSSPTSPSMTITEDYRILMNGLWNSYEVRLDPLTKALYFLYLRYPEGLSRTELLDRREEFTHIYKVITDTETLSPSKEKAIDNLLDPTDNSFNVSCARIKKAFLEFMEEDVAACYCIDGEQGKTKRIGFERFILDVR